MDNQEIEKRLLSIRGGKWNWIFAKQYYGQLLTRLEKYGISSDDVDDILRVALASAIEDEKWKKKNNG